jgi:phosphatidylglycerol:prolipoprotein diacylglycerol transferase
MSEDDLFGLFTWGIVGLILGARIFSTLVYETSDIYRQQPWLIFWPFRNGQFTGLMGMSYHGGVIGGLLGFCLFCKFKHYDVREIGDMFAASIPLGYTFGRLGNFINAELYGRVTTGGLGMIFPNAQRYSARLPWVQEAAEKAGIPIPDLNALVNLPRHPSQLYEAFFEGIVLWAIIWLVRNRKPFKGFLLSLYVGGYGLIRFFLEYLREPDADLGYRIELVKNGIPPALFSSFFNFTTGQILSFGMIVLAVVWLIIASRLPDREAIRVYPAEDEKTGGGAAGRTAETEKQQIERQNRRREQRKLRKKLR